MSVNEIISLINSDATWSAVKTGWTVPAGMVVLYFYGRSHFNTPAYSLDLTINTRVRLITPAPPIFTTRRSRYNSYANRYVLILEAAFLVIIFLYSMIQDIARAGEVQIPDLTGEPLQYRVIFALFVLTGLLSSFPVLKQIDVWLLERLHRAAFIPGDVRDLAAKLYNSTFVPKPNAIAAVRPSLSMRDNLRYPVSADPNTDRDGGGQIPRLQNYAGSRFQGNWRSVAGSSVRGSHLFEKPGKNNTDGIGHRCVHRQ